jgi:FAD/FMN-containing dehydrogenase
MEEGLLHTARTDKPELFWHMRHSISEALRAEGTVIAFDVATPFGKLPAFRHAMNILLKQTWPHLMIIPFGHEMLSACHFNILWPKDKELSDKIKESLRDIVYSALTQTFKGSFSAEHGIGPYNQHYYDRYTTAELKQIAASLKQRLDPNRILNPCVHFD